MNTDCTKKLTANYADFADRNEDLILGRPCRNNNSDRSCDNNQWMTDPGNKASDAARDAMGNVKIYSKDNGALKSTKIDIGKAQIVFSDDKGEMKIEPVDGKKVLTAKDPQGKLLFSGPVETKEDLDKVPAPLRMRTTTTKIPT